MFPSLPVSIATLRAIVLLSPSWLKVNNESLQLYTFSGFHFLDILVCKFVSKTGLTFSLLTGMAQTESVFRTLVIQRPDSIWLCQSLSLKLAI